MFSEMETDKLICSWLALKTLKFSLLNVCEAAHTLLFTGVKIFQLLKEEYKVWSPPGNKLQVDVNIFLQYVPDTNF